MTIGEEPSPAADRARLEVFVRGRVQGVGFRYFAWREAEALGLHGWVANEADGAVHCLAEGPRDRLELFAARLEAGPASSIVERVSTTWSAATGTLGPFGVRSGAHRGD